MTKELLKLKTMPIAHRGIFDNEKVPENSLGSFNSAIKKKCIIELDVHKTKDNILVVIHDYNLKRLTGLDKCVEDLTYDEISNLNLLNTNYKILMLNEVLKEVNGLVPLLIEIKSKIKDKVLINNLMNELKEYNGIYYIQSFNIVILKYLKKHYKDVYIGILYTINKSNKIINYLSNHLFYNIMIKPNFINVNINMLPNKYIDKYNGIVLCWTIRNKKDLEKAKKYADNYISEYNEKE